MRLTNRLPELPEDEGNFWTHNTGGEHMSKFIGTERNYNPLRRAFLSRIDGEPIEPITYMGLADMLSGYDQEVIFIDRHNLSEDKQGPRGLVAGAIAARYKTGSFDKTIKVTEMVVRPEVRQRGLAGFILGKAVSLEHYGSGNPTELIVDTSIFTTEEWFRNKLIETGFNHTDENGSPAIWLPGNAAYPNADLNDPKTIKKVLEPMPDDWNGYIADFYSESDPQTHVFRAGKLAGIVRAVEYMSGHDDTGVSVGEYTLWDAGDEGIGLVSNATREEALIALLNNYELIK